FYEGSIESKIRKEGNTADCRDERIDAIRGEAQRPYEDGDSDQAHPNIHQNLSNSRKGVEEGRAFHTLASAGDWAFSFLLASIVPRTAPSNTIPCPQSQASVNIIETMQYTTAE